MKDWKDQANRVDEFFRTKPNSKIEENPVEFYTLALSGEVGELANEVKKDMRGDNDPEFRLKVKKEMADIILYTRLLLKTFGFDADQICEEKIIEVSKRHNIPIIED